VEADLRGVHSHGANLMSLYVNRIRAGHIKPVTEVTVVADNGSTVQLDGGLGLGQIVGIQATDLSVERAKEHGLAAVSVRELTHLGALGFYTHRAAEQGVISLVVQNGPAFVPPYGGVTGLFSTNPFSYAFPAAEEEPVVFDIATTAVAGNKILLAKKRGDPQIPAGWASDTMGRPTTDTEAASIDNLQWFGGHKGYGVAFFVEVMAGVLANSSFGRTEHTDSPVHGKDRVAKGALFLAIDPARFPGGDAFGSRMDTLMRDVWSSEPAEGFEQVSVPGDIERTLRERRVREGIPLLPASVAELARIAGELGVEPMKIDS
jgi:LDH2 family malate/lactate/ureidoglycolate dehydrogenase